MMPDFCVAVTHCSFNSISRKLSVTYHASDTQEGAEAIGNVDIDPGISTAQINQAICSAAKSHLSSVYGVNFLPSDKAILLNPATFISI